MTRSRDPLSLSPHWHVDCRLETELPEDNVVGTRFLINTLFGSAAVTLLLFAGWLGYMNVSLRSQIRDLDQRMAESAPEIRDIKRMQQDYIKEAKKIDSAYALMKAPLFISGFTANLGRSLPPKMIIDSIESNDAAILVRGSIQDTFEGANSLFSAYLKQLHSEPELSPFFDKITQSDFKRTDERSSFEITFQRKAPPP